MFENLALEKIVNSVLDMSKKSKKLDEEILGLNLKYTQQYDGFSHTQVFDVGTITTKYDRSKAKVSVKFPTYEMTPFFKELLDLSEPPSEVKDLEQQLRDFYKVGDRILFEFDNFKQLRNPKQFSSKKDYVLFFEQAVDSYVNFNKDYQKLKNNACITGNDPRLVVKINLPELMKPLYGYRNILDDKIQALSTSKVEPAENVNLAMDKLKAQKKDLDKIISKYETLKQNEPEFVDNLSKGINLIEKPNKRIIRSVAKMMYEILSYNSK